MAIARKAARNGKKIIQAVGKEAKQMLGKVPGNIEAIRPMKDGVIADFTVTEQMLKQFIKTVHASRLFAPIAAHHHLRAVRLDPGRAPRDQGSRPTARAPAQVYLIEEPMAAAIGAGLPVSEATGSMVVDIGGGTTEVGVISLGGMVYKGSVRVGGDKFDEAIVNYIRRNYGMLIGEPTAEAIKKEIGSAFPGSEVREMEVKGRNLSEGIPRSFTISSNEILEALTDPLNQIVSAGQDRAGADAAGTGRRHRRARHDAHRAAARCCATWTACSMEETGLPVLVAEDPLTCVVRGCGMALERMDKLGSVFAHG